VLGKPKGPLGGDFSFKRQKDFEAHPHQKNIWGERRENAEEGREG